MSEDAKISVGADCSSAERAAAVLKLSWREAGDALKSSIGSAASAVVQDLGHVALAAGKVSFSSQHAQVREMEGASARMAVAMRRDLGEVRGSIEETGVAIGKRPTEVAAWSASVGALTYNLDGAAQGMKGLSGLAAETGRSVEDYKGLAVELGTVGHVAGDTTHAVGMLHSQADALGTVGGVAAFAGQVESLGDTISHFAGKSEADFLRVTAAAAVLGKGLGDAAARRAQQSVLGSIGSDPMGWSRYLGHDITDEHGQVKDPGKVLQDAVGKMARTYGSGGNLRRMLMLQFGSEGGAQTYNAFKSGDLAHLDRFANLHPSSNPADAQKRINDTDYGKRAVAEAELAKSSRDLLGSSTMLGRAADAMQQFAAHNPLTSTFVATALGMGMSTFLGGLGKSIATIMGGKGYGGAVGGAVDLATKGAGAPLGAAAKAVPLIGMGLAADAAIEEGLNGVNIGHGITFGELRGGGYGGIDKTATRTAVINAQRRMGEAFRRENVALDQSGLTGADKTDASSAATTAFAANPSLAMGGDGSIAAIAGELHKLGRSEADSEKLARVLADALKNIKIDVTNASDTPVNAAVNASSSSSAGRHG